MLYAIDIGNTRTKISVFKQNTIENTFIFKQENFIEEIKKLINNSKEPANIVISSVGKLSQEELTWLEKNSVLTIISHLSPIPFINKYETPQTLGIDRIVLTTGAALKFPNKNCLIIDAGTAITYDYITKNKEYLGGGISPGIHLRFKSLNDYTAKLPLISIEEEHPLIGKNTKNSILSGVLNGTTKEIEGIIREYQDIDEELIVILTGGDCVFLEKKIKNNVIMLPDFMSESLFLHYQYIINDKEHII